MNISLSNLEVRKKLAKYSNTSPDDWFLCLKARYGMATVFKAIHNRMGNGEVITCPYTCITAVNPILVANLKPIYCDIDPSTLSIVGAEEFIRPRTRAIVVQHTLGIMNREIQRVYKAIKDRNIILVEDCAHCLARMSLTHKLEPLADISVHSFGVEKVLQNTKFGGAIYVNPKLKDRNPKLYDDIISSLLDLPEPNFSLNLKIRSYRTENAIIQRLPGPLKNGTRSALLKMHAFEPAVSAIEQEADQGKAYNTNEFVNKTILAHIDELPSNYRRREQNVNLYINNLRNDHKFKLLTKEKMPLLAFPIVFKNQYAATEAYQALTSSGYFIRRWYSPLLYPGPTQNRYYYYESRMAPLAEDISKRVLCLPTNYSSADTRKIIKILNPVEKPVEKKIKAVEKSKK